MVPVNCCLITPSLRISVLQTDPPGEGCSGVLLRRPCHLGLTQVLLGLERWRDCPETPHKWDASRAKPTPAPLGTAWQQGQHAESASRGEE